MVNWVDCVGYLASVLVAISITIKGGFYFRILNLAGAICFLIYGIIIKSLPVILINIYAAVINTIHAVRLKLESKKEIAVNEN